MGLEAVLLRIEVLPLWESLPALAAWLVGRELVTTVAGMVRRRRSAVPVSRALPATVADRAVRVRERAAPPAA